MIDDRPSSVDGGKSPKSARKGKEAQAAGVPSAGADAAAGAKRKQAASKGSGDVPSLQERVSALEAENAALRKQQGGAGQPKAPKAAGGAAGAAAGRPAKKAKSEAAAGAEEGAGGEGEEEEDAEAKPSKAVARELKQQHKARMKASRVTRKETKKEARAEACAVADVLAAGRAAGGRGCRAWGLRPVFGVMSYSPTFTQIKFRRGAQGTQPRQQGSAPRECSERANWSLC